MLYYYLVLTVNTLAVLETSIGIGSVSFQYLASMNTSTGEARSSRYLTVLMTTLAASSNQYWRSVGPVVNF